MSHALRASIHTSASFRNLHVYKWFIQTYWSSRGLQHRLDWMLSALQAPQVFVRPRPRSLASIAKFESGGDKIRFGPQPGFWLGFLRLNLLSGACARLDLVLHKCAAIVQSGYFVTLFLLTRLVSSITVSVSVWLPYHSVSEHYQVDRW